ncbi:MAG: hypothetical protein B9S32_01995 [Verrucomicrobia bacterium Tous-C9LFEB]|nr:MAG: hypothetical protein B9S32_01995 [Verrucomicrobia bacterium Tous-C9LFEB]
MCGIAVAWIRATALWHIMKESNEKAGPGSFAVLYDPTAIRIGHTFSEDVVFHPAARLDATLVNTLVVEQRFGPKTREMLEDIRPFPEHHELVLSTNPESQVFRGIAPVNYKWNYGVGRRLKTVPWTVFYMIPEESINIPMARMTWHKTAFAGLIIALSLTAGAWFATIILKPIGALSTATQWIADGDLSVRVRTDRDDELGQLASNFNAMALQIETQATALQKARDELELRVQERTSELRQTAKNLESEIRERKHAEVKLQSQLGRLNLLNQITRAIGERQDLRSIFQVVIRTLEEQQPIDFCCLCLYDPTDYALTVTSVGVRSETMALELAMTEQSRVAIDENGLSRCVRGQLVYEPDIRNVKFPFPQRLAKGGLSALVAAPLLAESKVFGILVVARKKPHSFSSGECEFLRQLCEHVALASNQAQLYQALQQAYDDLRQTQESVMQQERLRSLGQMASGIAHDINNALSPVSLYTDLLLLEPDLKKQMRDHLQTMQRAVHDVAATVGRLREFYRERETQLVLTPVHLNQLVQQVIDLTRARWNDMPQQRGIVIQVQTTLSPNLPAIMGVESEIREALTNLVFNAVDAMPNGGTLSLRTQSIAPSVTNPSQYRVRVEVSDTGIGMDEDTRRHCLEPFFTTKGERGTGLGLAMVYGIIQRHSADIEIESQTGKGTTVRLIFAVSTETSAHEVQPPEPIVPARCRILIVDDDPLLIKSLCDTLKIDGHQIVATKGGQEGIDTFCAACGSDKPFDVVITDLGMPYVDGRKVAANVKALSPSTPVILLTGWGQRLVAEGDIPPHVDRVLNKPPKLNDLREALSKLTKA